MKKKRIGEGGFTLIELLLAMFVFSMVMAGLAVIYGTAVRQGSGLLLDTRTKAMGTVALRAIEKEVGQATRIEQPAYNTSGNHLRGWTNVSGEDGTPSSTNMTGVAADRHWFHFCVRTTALGSTCANGTANPPRCLFYYRGVNGGGYSATTGISNATCGTAQDGVTPELLASALTAPTGGKPGYFMRSSAAGVTESNQVRVSFLMMHGASEKGPPTRFEVDSSYHAQFSRIP